MGAVGEGAHASHEAVLIKDLIPRTALLAEMIRTSG
jgi:glutamate carboxypeptidase